jgi:hypothetical protein
MRRRPFLIFAIVLGVLVTGAVAFIQSPRFAGIVKRTASKYVPSDVGIEGDFSEFSIKLFPPGVSINKPRVTVRKRNILNLPEGSSVTAERIELAFLPFQMLTGDIRVHRVLIVQGDVKLNFDKAFLARRATKKSGGVSFHWDELVQIRAEAVELVDTRVRLGLAEPEIDAELLAKSLRVAQWSGRGGVGYEIGIELQDVGGKFPKEWKLPPRIPRLAATGHLNALGLELEDLSVSQDGVEISARGSIKGNLLNPKGLAVEAELTARGELGRITRLAGIGDPAGARGRVTFSGKVKGSLDRPMDTLRAEGSVTGEDVRFQAWEADKVVAEGAWVAAAGGGEISVIKATVTAREQSREGGHRPGRGGKLEAGPFKLRLGSRDPLEVPLTLERAHIHWLGAPGLRDVYPLDFRVSGPIHVTFAPGDPDEELEEDGGWRARARLGGVVVEGFQLDNQRLGKTKPLSRVLRIPKITLDGAIAIDPGGLTPENLTLTLPRTKFTASGRVDFKTGYDLQVGGPVNLEDIGQIAENDIRGQGTLAARVHGPSARTFIDFDADVQDAYYLRLKLGALKGRITWDDDPQHLFFRAVDVSKGRTRYTVDGMLDLGDAETVALDVDVPKGNVRDFIDVFEEQVRDIWWFPRTLAGETTGRVRVGGGIQMDRLEVAAALSGPNWEYVGEKFRTVAFRGGYDKGRYHVESLRAVKHTGKVSGRISYAADRTLDWELATEDFALTDLDHVARLDIPIRGELGVRSAGRGREGAIESETQVSLRGVSVRGVGMPPSELGLRSSGGVAVLRGTALGGQGEIDLSYDFKPGASSSLRCEFRSLDFSTILLLLNPKSIQDRALAGRVSGLVDLSFKTGQSELASGTVELNDWLLARTGARFELMRPVRTKVERGTFDLEEVGIRGAGSEARLRLRGRSAALDGTVDGALDVSIAQFFTSSVTHASGAAALDLRLGGELKAPTVLGRATIDRASLRVPSLDSPFENIEGVLVLRQNVVTVQGLTADLANGRIAAGGTIELFADRYPRLDLAAQLSGNKLKIYPFQFVKARGKVNVHGDDIPYVVDGQIQVESALSKEKVLAQAASPSLKSARYTPPPTLRQETDYPRFRLNIDVEGDRDLQVQNDLFDAELKAKVTLVNTIETPRLLGRAEVLQGKMTFKDRIFQIQSAAMEFDNPAVINPRFNLTATTDVGDNRIQLYVAGRLDGYKIELTSNPVMPESEILSLLALGFTSDDVKRLRSGDRTALEQGEAASLVLHSTDFNRDLKSKTGLQIQIDEAVDTQVGTSIFRRRSESEAASAPKIVIKRQIGKKVDVSVGSTVGVGTSSQKEVNAEVHVTPGFSIIGVWDTQEGADAQSRESYGVDLKLQKRFK